MKRLLFMALRVYRRLVSPVLGPCCRFEPSCSVYAEEAIHVHGVARGLLLAAWRVLRCQPFARAGVDRVPPRAPVPPPARPALQRPARDAS
ncbi:MAG TPA: membrane protein insertion efficiency factor YidD [Polyangia bacterium]|nr:membrane protein insertion efficiency factor YidD [Polyangia bacterium]